MPSYLQGQIVDKRLGLDVQISYPSELVGEITGKEEPIKSSCINEDEQRGRTWFWKTSKDRGCVPKLPPQTEVVISSDSPQDLCGPTCQVTRISHCLCNPSGVTQHLEGQIGRGIGRN